MTVGDLSRHSCKHIC